MFGLLVALATVSTINIIIYLYRIGDGKPVELRPNHYIPSTISSATFLAFTIYAILNWI